MSMGQWLCLPMIVAGVGLWVWAQRQPIVPRKMPGEVLQKSP
jgi:phosphatidylglycerol:prolipoprotein diacylglycerol transferase